MKKALAIVMALFMLAGCGQTGTADARKFKQEYEALNGKTNDSGKSYATVTIDADNPIVYATGQQIIDTLTKGSGIILFSFPECPWCRGADPVFLEMCKAKGVKEVLYYNNRDQRDAKELDASGKVVTTKEGTEEYKQILVALGASASTYDGLNDPSIKRIYFPTVVFVSAGVVTGTFMTLDSIDDPYQPLTQQQHDELLKDYEDLYDAYANAAKGCPLNGPAC